MASRVQLILIDDIDGGDADETISFAIDGIEYEIDLNAFNAEALREAFSPYIQAGRKVSTGSKRKAASTAGKSSIPSTEIRQWARANGYEVNSRGRLPADLIAAYEAATA